jgi:hypothetical protein
MGSGPVATAGDGSLAQAHPSPRRLRTLLTAIALAFLAVVPGVGGSVIGARAAGQDPVIAAAGDIACDPTNPAFNGRDGTPAACQMRATSKILVGLQDAGTLSAVLTLGDNQYRCGGLTAFHKSYDPTWGKVKPLTHPTPGDHEYMSTADSDGMDCSKDHDAAGYFKYFGAKAGGPARGYYSWDLPVSDGSSWHLIALNSNCGYIGGCEPGSPEEQWLRADLAANPADCTLAYWYQARFSSGKHGSSVDYDAFWRDLYAAGAEVVLNGHDHDYERFALQTPDQVRSPDGLREFVVGTGGVGHGYFRPMSELNSVVRNVKTYGVLQLTLHPDTYDWQFLPVVGKRWSDSGTGNCHN